MIISRNYFSEDFREYEDKLRVIKHSIESYRKGDVFCDVDNNSAGILQKYAKKK